ncbi:unannotated protein [freshwater metagenome]|uniref:Unannotated protein n=1 Tax=freshwater metagenome TaxID=449393 RepID=A0A6J7E054_9ZZZZ
MLPTAHLALATATVVLGIWLQRPMPVVGVVCGAFVVHRRPQLAVLCAVVGLLGVQLSNLSWARASPDRLGPFAGVACLTTDPAPRGGAVVAVFEIQGQRFETWARGSPRRRLHNHLAGECARVQGTRRALTGVGRRRAAVRHVVGGFDIAVVGDWVQGSPLDRASNRVLRLFGLGASRLRAPDDALFAGLVIGDDRNEPPGMVEQFRASGLSHLTAVSGQNVGFFLAAASPLLRRLRPAPRWLLTLALIAWFVALTRFEPSVLRAGVMAGIAATGYLTGREHPPTRVLVVAVGVLVLIDPLLVWSVGFWLSVGATAGVALLGTALVAYLPGPRWIAVPAAVTLGAQAGVAPVSLLVFGTMPLVSVPANLLAVPVAGFVMLYGLPAGLVAGSAAHLLGGRLAELVQMPSAVGTRWVATVAGLGARLSPGAVWTVVGWSVLVLVILARLVAGRRRDYAKVVHHGAASHHR